MILLSKAQKKGYIQRTGSGPLNIKSTLHLEVSTALHSERGFYSIASALGHWAWCSVPVALLSSVSPFSRTNFCKPVFMFMYFSFVHCYRGMGRMIPRCLGGCLLIFWDFLYFCLGRYDVSEIHLQCSLSSIPSSFRVHLSI